MDRPIQNLLSGAMTISRRINVRARLCSLNRVVPLAIKVAYVLNYSLMRVCKEYDTGNIVSYGIHKQSQARLSVYSGVSVA